MVLFSDYKILGFVYTLFVQFIWTGGERMQGREGERENGRWREREGKSE